MMLFIEQRLRGVGNRNGKVRIQMAAPKAGDKPAQNAGKSVFTVKCDSRGAWKIARLIANSDDSPTDPDTRSEPFAA